VELSTFPNSKMEADLEVSIFELYYSAKHSFRKYKKGSVCEEFAIKRQEKRLLFVKNYAP
jgi:hypothetical protein